MKKTKIIVPALAALCVGVAASVSGTLAWFSAAKTKSVGVNNIAVINTQGSLMAEVKASKNTQVDGENISLAKDVKLRDASAQLAKSSTESYVVWEATDAKEDGTATKYQSVATDLVYNKTQKICYAATWSITFTLAGSEPTDYGIYFDASNSSVTVADGDVSAIYGAFRVAIYNADTLIVWNNLCGEDKLDYVNSASSKGQYTRQKTAVSMGTIGTEEGGSEAAKELKVWCMVWFEGEDDACNKDVLAEGVVSKATADLKFYAA